MACFVVQKDKTKHDLFFVNALIFINRIKNKVLLVGSREVNNILILRSFIGWFVNKRISG